MTPVKPSPSIDPVHEEMEAIFSRLKDRPRPALDSDAVTPRSRARKTFSTHRKLGRFSKLVTAPVILGCMLAATLGGVLALVERSDISVTDIAARPPTELDRTAKASSMSNRPPVVAAKIDPTTQTASRSGGDTLSADLDTLERSTAQNGRGGAPSPTRSPPAAGRNPSSPEGRRIPSPARAMDLPVSERGRHLSVSPTGGTGEATVRKFYDALGAGNGEMASAQVITEKRLSPAFSPEAISRFYGGLPEPIRLTEIRPLAAGAYRVSYRYSAGSRRCNGGAVVHLTRRGGRDYIRSIRALDGC
ncbi:hypothetical protein [uncultured Sphingomonas sp.]|uniref:hypothetical protein n=1 Tax=uncultured Sphingomonas sp. TaxID=158754 RepID=UPI0035CBBCA7